MKILVEGGLAIKLRELIGDNPQLARVLLDRVQYYFREFAASSTTKSMPSWPPDWTIWWMSKRGWRRSGGAADRNFEPLAASFKRIAEHPAAGAVYRTPAGRAGLLEAGPESELYNEFLRIRDVVFTHRKSRNYQAALEAIASLRPRVDMFFDKVLVNAPDERVRQNRLLLLSSLLTEFSTIADFSEIVTTH